MEDKQRYLRLQLLLEKSNIYCQFLLEKMERQKLEARKQQEKTAHQLEKKQSKEKDSVQMVIPIKKTCTTTSFWVQAQAEKCHKIFVDFRSKHFPLASGKILVLSESSPLFYMNQSKSNMITGHIISDY